jgi:hypothetical protein
MRISEQRKRERMRELQRMADHVCSLILISDYPEIDIEIERWNETDISGYLILGSNGETVFLNEDENIR